MKRLLSIFLLSVLVFASCTSKKDYIKEYRSFVDEVKEGYRDYGAEQWEAADERFREYSEDMYKDFFEELTEEEVREVNILGGIYLGLKMSKEAEGKIKDLKNK